MKAENTSLIVTAHPDDETIFFAGLILSRPKTRWHVVCVTDGNADNQGVQRIRDFEKACLKLGVDECSCLKFPDIYEKRINISDLQNRLGNFEATQVFTHGILGEYGHPHHQDVSYAVHQQFANKIDVYSVAQNNFPEILISLNYQQWSLKAQIYSEIYFSETQRFIQMLPIQFTEGFDRVSLQEVENIYQFLIGEKDLDTTALASYSDIEKYLLQMNQPLKRPF